MPKNLLKNKKFPILTNLQKKFLLYFSAWPGSCNFYWTGGTALAEVYLKHRLSQDIDLFTEQDVSYADLINLIENFVKQEKNISRYTASRLHDRKLFVLINQEELKVEFSKYEYPAIKQRKLWLNIPVLVDNLEDIATNKAMSIMDRFEPKDTVDLYYILKFKPYSLGQILKWLKIKFGPSFNKRTLIAEMIDRVNLIDKVEPLLLVAEKQRRKEIQKIKDYYEQLAEKYLKEIIY